MVAQKDIKKTLFIITLLVTSVWCTYSARAVEEAGSVVSAKSVTIEEFIYTATRNDSEFEKILMDELTVQYRKDLFLPSRDIVLAVKSDYDFFLDQDRQEPNIGLSLSKLFPYTGTRVLSSYTSAPSYTKKDNTSEALVSITQPIAQNAFGRSTRLHDKIIGIEMEVIRHQIIEAYEEYFATIITAYYAWYEAYENLKIGESAYAENLKLLDNIKERQTSKIALPIDVNKTHLQVLAKKENIIRLTEEYEKSRNVIKTAMRYTGEENIIPIEPHVYENIDVFFDTDFTCFRKDGRTFSILTLLEEKSTLDVARSADDLLPSIDLKMGYSIKGDDHTLKNSDNFLYTGFSIEYPFPDQVDRAEFSMSQINEKKAELDTANVYYALYTYLKNVSLAIEREKTLLSVAEEKIILAQDVLKDETENFTYGKVSLNDYIQAVNVYDTNRFNQILHRVNYKKLIIEWLRLTDLLITKKDIENYRP
jgi:outer membrane protein TolC